MPELSIQQAVVHAVSASGLPPQARLLDLSCGEGEIMAQLAERGYDIEGTHYRDDDYIIRRPSAILQKAVIHHGIDLARPLPFPSSSYDGVLATEVLEHLPSHAAILAEVGRILKPGGVFIFSTPNIHRLSSRWQFFLTGTHNLCGARLGWHTPPDALYSTHYNPVYYPVMHSLLYQQGLLVQRLMPTSVSPLSVLTGVTLSPLLFAATALEVRHAWKRSSAGGRDLARHLLNPCLLTSKQLVVVARKQAG